MNDLASAPQGTPRPERQRKPDWIRVKAPVSKGYQQTRALMRELNLNTVCEEAACPNIGECWTKKHATVMILGDTCTRACAFCNVKTGMPGKVDPLEPEHVAIAAAKLGLEHIVVTSVDRDDLPDGGAGQFVKVIEALRRTTPNTTIEILTPDFRGRMRPAVEAIVAARTSGGEFRDLFDFCERVHPTQVSRATIETLIKAGAFDSLRARRAQNMAAVVFSVDAEAATGQPALSNEQIADQAAEHADVLIPFASIDPARGQAGVRAARRLVERHGVRGFKFHPSLQDFQPNDRRVYPLYEQIEQLGVPALFHTGQTGIGAGLPGGRGIKLRYSDPMLIDDVAADFPGLTVILAHPSVPWQDAALSIATHKANVYIDLSGWSPRYFPPQLVRAAGGRLAGKMLFGSDYPLITPERWLADFEKLPICDEVRPEVIKGNAARLLKL